MRSGADDAFRVAAELTAISARAGARAYAITRHYGQLVQTQVKANASGRPGPRAVTGDYRRSVALVMTIDNGGPVAIIGTNKPQGRRLEFGFHDVDALGRRYSQAPLPHFAPALRKYEDAYVAAIAGIVDL